MNQALQTVAVLAAGGVSEDTETLMNLVITVIMVALWWLGSGVMRQRQAGQGGPKKPKAEAPRPRHVEEAEARRRAQQRARRRQEIARRIAADRRPALAMTGLDLPGEPRSATRRSGGEAIESLEEQRLRGTAQPVDEHGWLDSPPSDNMAPGRASGPGPADAAVDAGESRLELGSTEQLSSGREELPALGSLHGLTGAAIVRGLEMDSLDRRRGPDDGETTAGLVDPTQLDRGRLREGIVLAEVLGPPVALRAGHRATTAF